MFRTMTGSDPERSIGVVGSVVPLTILAVVVFLWSRHRRQQTQQPQMMPTPMPDDDPYKQRPMSYGVPPMTNFTPYVSLLCGVNSERLY